MAKGAPGVPALSLQEEFELFYRRYVKDVYRYALALLHNPADAEDVTQTTFMNAYRAFQRGTRPIKPHNWLIEIADTLGASVAAVETLIFRARRSLRVRAAELRVLGAVPLPGSLSQLFGGGAVAGGGAPVRAGGALEGGGA